MLRASADANDDVVDLAAVGDETRDIGLAGGRTLSAITEAAVLRDEDERSIAYPRAVEAVGSEATSRIIAVAANFEMMNRLLDGAGVGPTPAMRPIGELIGVPLPPRFAAN